MKISDSKNINISKIDEMNFSSPIKQNKEDINKSIFNSTMQPTKSVQLDDFFGLLDEKTVKKIIDTPADSKTRIIQDIANIEYEIDGAKSILNSLG